MDSFFLNVLPLFAEGTPESGGSNWMITLFTLWLPILFLLYFLMIRPQRQEHAKRKTMLDALKKNDRVITIGGIYATVANVHREADEISLKIDEATNTKIRVGFSAIARVLEQSEPSDTSKK